MKNILLFEQFINESHSSAKVADAMVKLFVKAGFPDPTVRDGEDGEPFLVQVELPDGTKKAPAEIIKLENNGGITTVILNVNHEYFSDFMDILDYEALVSLNEDNE